MNVTDKQKIERLGAWHESEKKEIAALRAESAELLEALKHCLWVIENVDLPKESVGMKIAGEAAALIAKHEKGE